MRIRASVWSILLFGVGCWNVGESQLGDLAHLRITAPIPPGYSGVAAPPPGAQFFSGHLPKPSDGPAVTDVDSINTIIYPGERGRPISGRVATGTEVVAIGLDGDIGYWVVPVGAADGLYPGEIDFSAQGYFSTNLALGNHTVHYEAGDSRGHYGAPNDQQLVARDVNDPEGLLLVHAEWDTESDLDLHVVQPDGTDVWAKRQTSYERPPPGSPPSTPADIANAGILQFDSNGMCVIDGMRKETAVWKVVPSGTWTVRMDAFSMCGQTHGAWSVQVEQRTDPATPGKIIATASGSLYPQDTQFPHTDGSGAFVLTFKTP